MKSRSSVKATRVLTLAALGCIISQFLAGSVALSQPFPLFMLDTTFVKGPGLGDASGQQSRLAATSGRSSGSRNPTCTVQGSALPARSSTPCRLTSVVLTFR
jgi:hypothetical protein